MLSYTYFISNDYIDINDGISGFLFDQFYDSMDDGKIISTVSTAVFDVLSANTQLSDQISPDTIPAVSEVIAYGSALAAVVQGVDNHENIMAEIISPLYFSGLSEMAGMIVDELASSDVYDVSR